MTTTNHGARVPTGEPLRPFGTCDLEDHVHAWTTMCQNFSRRDPLCTCCTPPALLSMHRLSVGRSLACAEREQAVVRVGPLRFVRRSAGGWYHVDEHGLYHRSTADNWLDLIASLRASLAVAEQERDALRAREGQWINFAVRVGDSVQCLASTFPDGNVHIEKRVAVVASRGGGTT